MANGFIKINHEFLLKDSEDYESSVITQLNDNGYGVIEVSILLETGASIGFSLTPDKLVEGEFSVIPQNDMLKVNCNGVFKLAVKDDHLENFLRADSKWVFGGVGDKYLNLFDSDVVDGLQSEKYTYKNRFGEGESIRHLMSIQTATKAKDLK
jgi:hypothetical protein